MPVSHAISLPVLLRSLAQNLGLEQPLPPGPAGPPTPEQVEAAGRRALYNASQEALTRLRDHRYGRNVHVDTILNRYGIRSKWRIQLARENLPAGEFYRLLTECLTVLEITMNDLVDSSPRCRPWCDWKAGDTLLVVKGSTHLVVCRDNLEFTRPFIGVADATAETRITAGLRNDLKIDARVEHLHLLEGLDPAAAADRLVEFRRRPDLGAIVFLGSPRVNPMADAAARAFYENGRRHASAVHFEWAEPPLFGDNFLSSPRTVGTAEEGIHYSDRHYTRRLRRVNDGIALREALENPLGEWDDAGLLLVDVRQRPWIILASGHGGCGTVACVLSLLLRPYDLDRQLAASLQAGFYLGPNRALQLIRVRRTKPTPTLHDDFTFDPETGWDIVGPWLPPASPGLPA